MTAGIDVDGEVGVYHQAVDLHVVAAGGGAQVCQVVGVLGVVAGEALAEPLHQVRPQDGGQLGGGPLAVEGVGADEIYVLLRHAGFAQLLQYRFDSQAAHRPKGGHRGVIEGYEDASARAHQLADAGEAQRSGQRLADRGVLVGHRLQARAARSAVAADNLCAARKVDVDGAIAE